MRARVKQWLAITSLAWSCSLSVFSQRFFPDDPLWIEPRLSIPKPAPFDESRIGYYFASIFLLPSDDKVSQALNINTLGEVPDSDWFTNRIGVRTMSMDELIQGPNRGSGPDLSRPWRVVQFKSKGTSPGFVMQDARGDTYFVKFDVRTHPQLSTSSEVIATKFYYAFGYNVPENYLVSIDPARIELDPEAGKKGEVSRRELEGILEEAARLEDGKLQALASLQVEGQPLGLFLYSGTRPDDPNDVLPHENRRELRGLRVLASWLNDNDARALNTLDVYVNENGRQIVKHYLIDFGHCFGSGTYRPKTPASGHEYGLEWGPLLKSATTLGIWERSWQDVEFSDYPVSGHFEAEHFDPPKWKTTHPNPAFKQMLPADGFWASKIVARFSNEMIRALVRTGRIAQPEDENHLAETLIRRRDKILHYYFAQVNPLDDFRVLGSSLQFRNLGEEAGLGRADRYHYEWFVLDNERSLSTPLDREGSVRGLSIPLPHLDAPYTMVRLRTHTQSRPLQEGWAKAVDVYIRNQGAKKVIGIERQ
ncbi:MAG: hypothetical protein ACRD1R_10085 [Acidobacteriota bacterium]